MSKIFTEGRHTGEFLLSEGPGSISREPGQLAPGAGIVKDGTLMGKVTATSLLVPQDPAATDGSNLPVGFILGSHVRDAANPVDVTVIARHAEVKLACLTFKAAMSTAAERAPYLAQLEAVILR